MRNITFFQAANLSDAEVKSQFIVRKREYELVMSVIKSDNMEGSIQHFIYIGQRGCGKSTVLRRIQAEISTDEELSKTLIAINLSEEQAGIYKLHDLWNRVIEELQIKNFDVDALDWEKYGDDTTAYTRALYETLQKALHKKGKKLVLLLDNIDRILENIKLDDNHLFRELLMNHKDVRIIGGSTRLSEHHWKYEQPFYQFFRIIRIEALTQNELQDLLIFWSECLNEPKLKQFVEKSKGKLNAVRILSDGMPRTMLNLVELLINKPEEHGYEYLRYIIDRATPVYQERLTTLSPLQQKVLLELSFFWDAVKVKEVSDVTRTDSKLLSGVLKQLVDLKIVEKKKGKGKNLYYLLKERFFNLWLVMTQGGPKQKAKVKWLTVFLETWYDASELKQAYGLFSKDLMDGLLPVDHAVLMKKAFVHSKYIDVEERDQLVQATEAITQYNADYKGLLPANSSVIYNKVWAEIERKDFDKAEKYLMDIEQDDAYKYTINGYLFHLKGDFGNAEKKYLIAKKKGDVSVLNELANLYNDQSRFKEAEKYYLLAIDKGIKSAFNNLAILYSTQNRFEEAEKYYLLAIDYGIDDANFNLAILYKEHNKIEEAEKLYLSSIDNGNIEALINLANLYLNNSRFEEAEKYYIISIEKGKTEALNNLANLYRDQNKIELAEKNYLLAISQGYTFALYNLALFYEDQNRIEEAEKFYLQAIDNGNVYASYSYSVLLWNKNGESNKSIENFNKFKNSTTLNINELVFEKVLHLWAGKPEIMEGSIDLIRKLLAQKEMQLLEALFQDAIIFYQKNTVWEWFNNKEFGNTLRDMLKPYYFVTAHLLKLEELILTQPPELNEPIESIISNIKERQQFYFNKKD
jgi:tetratricopeptide (TPR) repeat protein